MVQILTNFLYNPTETLTSKIEGVSNQNESLLPNIGPNAPIGPEGYSDKNEFFQILTCDIPF